MAKRDDFSVATKAEIAQRAGYVCSHPTCDRLTVGPSADRASGVTMVGVAAHIAAAAPGGERYDPAMTAAQRKSASNGIWMCALHGKWIDDNPSVATTERLIAWKNAHEAETAAWVEHGHAGIFRSWDRLAALTRDQRGTIETSLPNGHYQSRDGTAMIGALQRHGACLVNGDSGVGKSALVLETLDQSFPDARQVWLGPDALENALGEATRGGIGLTAPLGDLLAAAAAGTNILVLDAVERAGTATIARLGQLVRRLQRERTADSGWTVVAIAQQAGFEAHLDPLLRALGDATFRVQPLEPEHVRSALFSVPALAQHAFDEAFVALLGNLKALGWMISATSASAASEVGRIASRPQIADRLWEHWTGGDPDIHGFMIRLARRDADYERSFALSDLSQEDRTAWKAGRQRIPLRLTHRNRLGFEHDLATDWARYQYLKEVTEEIDGWTGLADQPLWVASLRLFGQNLLRDRIDERNGWDWAFDVARERKLTSAINVLLDALCLDPAADGFLTERLPMLLADDGRLLDRLIARFMHIATVPGPAISEDPDIALYAEANMRTPLWNLWIPMIRFFMQHQSAIGALGSPFVAKFCEAWLTKAPSTVGGRGVVGRGEIAELAVETARVRQVLERAGAHVGGRSDDETALFTAALAGAADRREIVEEFALEMARRRELSAATQSRVTAVRREERARRTRDERLARLPSRSQPPISILFDRKLPPWPLGPSARLDGGFRDAVMKQSALASLMRVSPRVAGEVLLACMIDDEPRDRGGGFRLDWDLGLEHEHDGRPVLFWNSPFFPFLAAAPEAAVETLLRLVEFCTERWAAEVGEQPASLHLLLEDGACRSYVGDRKVLDWAHARNSTGGQLYSALDALERWLWARMKAGEDIRPLCVELLGGSTSVAIIGVLADCAKFRPELLKDALAPLLTSPVLFLGERARLGQRFGTAFFAWQRAGAAARAMGLEWEQAPHRLISLADVVRDLRGNDRAFDEQVEAAVSGWPVPAPEMSLRQRVLAAELDPANWQEVEDVDGRSVRVMRYPEDIAAEIEASTLQPPSEPDLRAVLGQFQKMVGVSLNDEEAAEIYATLDDEAGLAPFVENGRDVIETAVAGVLFAGAGDWVARGAGIFERLAALVDRAVPEARDGMDFPRQDGMSLSWACVGAVHALANGFDDPKRWERIVTYGLATGNPAVVGTIVAMARGLRGRLGPVYDGMIEAGVFSSALDALRPRMADDVASEAIVERWRRRLERRPLSTNASIGKLDLPAIAARVDRLWRSRYRRAYGRPPAGSRGRGKRRRYSSGLSSHILAVLFDWALDQDVEPSSSDLPEHRAVVATVWRFQDWLLRGEPEDDPGDGDGFDRLDDFGLKVLRTIAARTPLGDASESRPLWEPVLALGPRGGFTVEHLIDCMFLRLYKDVDPANFTSNWDAMLEFVFDPKWIGSSRWWRGRSIFRHVLGIDASSQLSSNPSVAAHVGSLSHYFEIFAADHVAHDGSAMASLAAFLVSGPGAPLRLAAIGWIDRALAGSESRLASNAGSALADFVRVILTEHGLEIVENRAVRQSLINVIGRMVRDEAPYALALQDRARAMR